MPAKRPRRARRAPTRARAVAQYVLNTNSKKFHLPSCSSVDQMSPKNREDVEDTRENLIANGYDPCKRCNPEDFDGVSKCVLE